ncbi:MAG: PD40 domain-containing protein [Chloroflexi bacterium]|nr:PD40 domain-containing protein [Chloroflexota bacterium]
MFKTVCYSLAAVMLSLVALWAGKATPDTALSAQELSPTPTATYVPLPDHCAATNDTYHLKSKWVEAFRFFPLVEPTPLPKGRYQIIEDDAGTFIVDTANGERLQLAPDHPWTPLSQWARWSPDGTRLALLDSTAPLYAHAISAVIYDFTNGLPGTVRTNLPTNLNHPDDLYGWSPNGHYLLTIHSDWATNNGLSLWDVEQAKITYTDQAIIMNPTWSPDSSALIYGWIRYESETGEKGLTWVTADGSRSTRMGPVTDIYHDNMSFLWSPNGDKVALLYTYNVYEDYPFVLTVYAYDHSWNVHSSVYVQREPFQFGRRRIVSSPVTWVDNDTLLFWEQTSPDQYRMLRWSPVSELATLRETSRPPFFPALSPDESQYSPSPYTEIRLMTGRRIALYNDLETLFSIDVMDLDGGHPVRLIDGADDAGDPGWSPRGNKVLAIWDADAGLGRQIRLSWMNADGTGYQEFTSTHYDLQKVRWSPDEQVITFAGIDQGSTTYSLEMLDLITGRHTVLAENVEAFIDPRFEYDQAYIALRWRDTAGHQFADGFARDGSRLYRFPVLGLLWAARLFVSPDGQFAAIKEMPLYNNDLGYEYGELLVIARADNAASPLIVQAGLSGLGDPLWSPDGQFVAITWQPEWRAPVIIEIFNTAGESVWQATFDYPPFGTWTEWIACPT